MRIGLVGYGGGGRYFHAPYIEAADGCELVGIVARAASTITQANADWPGVPTYDSLAELVDAGVDAVTVSTPPATRRALVLESINRGIHVVADKPFGPTAAAAMDLVRAAEKAGVLLSVFHNRRWDSDIQTLRKVIGEQPLGEVWRFDSRFDFDDRLALERGTEGGLLRDLGSHVVDQAMWLFGPVLSVYADLDWLDEDGSVTDAGFVMSLRHVNGMHSHLSASKVSGVVSRELRVMGSQGSYVSNQSDVQTQAILAGRKPVDDLAGWGFESEARWGTLKLTGVRPVKVRSEQGAYHEFYRQFAAAVRGEGSQPVPAAEAVGTLHVLDAARSSARDGRVVSVVPTLGS